MGHRLAIVSDGPRHPGAVLVTGGSGYIGLQTVRHLRSRGLRVVALDRRPPPSVTALLGARFELADVRHARRLSGVLLSHRVRAVVHCAAHKSVEESVSAPERYFANNVGGSLALLDAMRSAGVRELVFSSSCSVYGTPDRLPVTEDSPLRPENPYAETKLLVERMLPWFETAHGLRWVSLRYFNAAGASPDGLAGEEARRARNLIPVVMQALRGAGPPLTIHGTDYPTPDGTAIRDYVHVLDIAEGHALALDHLADGGESAMVNLGSGAGSSVREVIAAAERVTGRSLPVLLGPRRPGDPAAVWADRRRAEALLGWRPQFTLDDMLRSAWRWHTRGVRQGANRRAIGA
jgi:UDP-glucose-4-epimerase GalE